MVTIVLIVGEIPNVRGRNYERRTPQAASRHPQAAYRTSQVASRHPQAASAVASRSAAAEINQAVADAMQLKRTRGFLVQKYFASNTGAMAAWHTVAHVEQPPKKKTSANGGGGNPPFPTVPPRCKARTLSGRVGLAEWRVIHYQDYEKI